MPIIKFHGISSREVESTSAAIISQELQKINYPHSDVFYSYLSEEGYYVNGTAI